MTRVLELPEAIYEAVEREAASRGLTPAGWVAALLPSEPRLQPVPGRTLADVLAGRTGLTIATEPHLSSESPLIDRATRTLADDFAGMIGLVTAAETDLSAKASQKFADYLDAKQRAGNL